MLTGRYWRMPRATPGYRTTRQELFSLLVLCTAYSVPDKPRGGQQKAPIMGFASQYDSVVPTLAASATAYACTLPRTSRRD